jgi:hypothetical protein
MRTPFPDVKREDLRELKRQSRSPRESLSDPAKNAKIRVEARTLMVTIQIDEKTAEGLERKARSAGLSIADYLRTLVPTSDSGSRPTWDEIENQFVALSTPAPSLPSDFPRADIYGDHD